MKYLHAYKATDRFIEEEQIERTGGIVEWFTQWWNCTQWDILSVCRESSICES